MPLLSRGCDNGLKPGALGLEEAGGSRSLSSAVCRLNDNGKAPSAIGAEGACGLRVQD
jgi:hypothetical protein